MVAGVMNQYGERILRFLRKPARQKIAAVVATARYAVGQGTGPDPGEGLAGHRLAPPAVLRAREPRYLAVRPDSDLTFAAYPELATLGDIWVRSTPRNAGDLPRLYSLVLNIRAVMAEGVTGDFAELGVWHGNSAAVLAHYARQAGREVALFDTFEGFDPRDLVGLDRNRRMEFDDASLDAVRRFVGEERVRFLPGRFPDSIPADMATSRFSVVHLDCDLYAPIKAGLEFFFPRLSPGGLMIVHDYSGVAWDGVKQAVD